MFSVRSIRTRILLLVIGVGLVMSFLLAVVAPWQARTLAGGIMSDNARFMSELLVDNLSLGMQTWILDDGATVDQTLSSLREGTWQENATITDVWVFDDKGRLVKSLNEGGGTVLSGKQLSSLEIEDLENVLRVYSPLTDTDGAVLGSVIIDISKSLFQSESEKQAVFFILMALASLGVSIFLALWQARIIGTPLSRISEIAEAISQGDISHELNIRSKDEVGKLAESFRKLITYMRDLSTAAGRIAANDLTVEVTPRSERDMLGQSFNTMKYNLSSMVRQLGANAHELVSAANEISSSSEQMSKGATEQTDQVAQVSRAVEEMTSSVMESSQSATHASEASRAAAEMAGQGGCIVGETVEGMQTIANVVKESASSIGKLAKSAEQIGEIISVIDDIADQTNLLALNAAIEAARAGEQGRGFAVVADEVRKLAERTGKATAEIAEMIKSIQTETDEAVRVMESGIEEVGKGRELADQAGSSLNEIVTMSQNVMTMIESIATAAEEQSSASEQISHNIESISSVARETANGAQQSASAAEQLNRQAECLQQMVSRFKIGQVKS